MTNVHGEVPVVTSPASNWCSGICGTRNKRAALSGACEHVPEREEQP